MMRPSDSPRKRSYVLLPPTVDDARHEPDAAASDDAAGPPLVAVQVALREFEGAAAVGAVATTAPGAPSTPADYLQPPELGASAPAIETELHGAEPSEPVEAPHRSSLSEFLVAVLPSAVGAGLAWFVAGETGADPVTWMALGAAAGFLLGWGCLLWIRREG